MIQNPTPIWLMVFLLEMLLRSSKVGALILVSVPIAIISTPSLDSKS